MVTLLMFLILGGSPVHPVRHAHHAKPLKVWICPDNPDGSVSTTGCVLG